MASEREHVKESTPSPCMLNIAVVMAPLPAQGHLNSLLHLSSHIASRRIHVHYVGSAIHNRQARMRLHGRNLASAASHLHFHDLPFPSIASPSPSPTSNPLLQFPSHLQPSFDAATTHLLPHLSSLLHSLSPSHHRIVLLHDASMSFTTEVASPITNAETFAFHPTSALTNLLFSRQQDLSGNPLRFALSDEFVNFLLRQQSTFSKPVGRLFNTCREIEGSFLDQLHAEPLFSEQRFFAVGPLNPIAIHGRSKEECLSWLDEQLPASVLYVSFGTTSSMLGEQIRELAAGLEASGQPFLWVRRDADRCDIFESGEDGHEDIDLADFRKRVEGRGRVERGWAPQLEILNHPSTGGFLSHCGWNSCMEAMTNGVPMLTWPMHSDQPVNAILLTEVLKIGIAVKKWAETEELITAAAVKEAVVRLMTGEGDGKDVRRRATEVGEMLRAAVMEGGSSKEDFDAFLAYVSRP